MTRSEAKRSERGVRAVYLYIIISCTVTVLYWILFKVYVFHRNTVLHCNSSLFPYLCFLIYDTTECRQFPYVSIFIEQLWCIRTVMKQQTSLYTYCQSISFTIYIHTYIHKLPVLVSNVSLVSYHHHHMISYTMIPVPWHHNIIYFASCLSHYQSLFLFHPISCYDVSHSHRVTPSSSSPDHHCDIVTYTTPPVTSMQSIFLNFHSFIGFPVSYRFHSSISTSTSTHTHMCAAHHPVCRFPKTTICFL